MAVKTIRWSDIKQPGEFYRFVGDYLIEDRGDTDNVYRVLWEDGEFVYVEFEHERY